MQSTVGPLREAIAGVGGSIMGTLVCYPLDVAKHKLITGNGNKGVLELIASIIVRKGVSGLYRGLSFEMFKNTMTNFTYLYAYTILKNKLVHLNTVTGSMSDHLGVLSNLVIGCIAGCAAQTFVNPLNLIATQLQVQTESTAYDVFLKIVSEGGFLSLYKGLVPSYVLSLNPAIQYLVFDQMKFWWLRSRVVLQKEKCKGGEEIECDSALVLSSTENFILGAVAKIVASYFTYPMIVAKTRIHAGATGNMFSTIISLFRSEGFLALYKGVTATILKSVLMSAILFMVKEWLIEYMFEILKKPEQNTQIQSNSN